MQVSKFRGKLRRKFRFNRPQQFAALLLLLLLAQCLWVVWRQSLTARDYQFARCGREMWEKPSPLAGYFTSCGNIADGTLAYRAAGLPLTLQRILAGESASTSTWEARNELHYVLLLMRLPFLAAGLFLGGALWWVTRRLYGNEGGYVALSLYCVSPAVVEACTYPNNEILAAFGLFAATYTAIGVAHAMQGPPRKWKPRILLLTAAFALTAAAHIAAALVGFLLALVLLAYLAEGRRAYVLPILMIAGVGTVLGLFASYTFNLDAFSYVLQGGAARIGLSFEAARHFFGALPNAGIAIAAGAAALLYFALRRSRYFGNTAPLVMALLLFPLVTFGVETRPWLWALPFLLTFIGGVFADLLESRYRRLFFYASLSLVVLQTALSLASLPALAR